MLVEDLTDEASQAEAEGMTPQEHTEGLSLWLHGERTAIVLPDEDDAKITVEGDVLREFSRVPTGRRLPIEATLREHKVTVVRKVGFKRISGVEFKIDPKVITGLRSLSKAAKVNVELHAES